MEVWESDFFLGLADASEVSKNKYSFYTFQVLGINDRGIQIFRRQI